MPQPTAPRWTELTRRTLFELETCDPAYRPTNFWGPGVRRLLASMDEHGLETFKSWPEALFWFYPVYAVNLPQPNRRRLLERADALQPGLADRLRPLLNGLPHARRDFDAARLAWDQERWPFDTDAHGESQLGKPTRLYRLSESDARWGQALLNYLVCLAGLSRHVAEPPRSFLELGGGFGALGELVLSRDPEARYVNCDIPPLLTVSSYYLTELFGDERVLTYDDQVAPAGPVKVPRSGCLPSWRLPDLEGPFDVFVNSFSFQEMEPDVVANYADVVSGLDVQYIVSLNSRKGKVQASETQEVGVLDPVTSSRIIGIFEDRGYELCSTYNRPLVFGGGELAILRRT